MWELLTRGRINEKQLYYNDILEGPPSLIVAMQCCCSERPEDRPTFKQVVQHLNKNHSLELSQTAPRSGSRRSMFSTE